MNKTNHTEEEIFEQAVDLMEDLNELTDEELSRFEEDADLKQACKELLECKTAVRKEFSENAIDINKEWERFQTKVPSKRPAKRYYWIGAGISAAAIALFVILYAWLAPYSASPEGIQVFAANDQIQEVVLQTSNGKQIALNAATADPSLHAIGATFTQSADSMALVYDHTAEAEVAETHALSTPRGQDFKLTLDDGSIVWLNAESRIEYPSRFTGEERRVRLHGEAYFQVAPDKEHPFVVETPEMLTRVLGTEFNVSTYSGEASHVTLIKGSVEVKSQKSEGNEFIRITPGEDAQLQADGTFELKQVDTDSYIYWKEGFFFFDNIPLADIMQSLGRWYNVNVVFVNEAAMRYKMHYMCERNGGIEHAVELFNMMRKVKVEFKGNTLYIR